MGLLPRASAAPSPYTVPSSQKFDGNDGSWSTFKISVGTPGQNFRVLPSTKFGTTNVIVPDGCRSTDPANCAQSRGIDIFNSAQNIGFQANASSTWSTIGQYDVSAEQALGYNASAFFGFDKVTLGAAAGANTLSMDRQIVSGIADTDYFLGMLPLGQAKQSFDSLSQPIDSLLYQLRNFSRIPSFSYAYTAGAKYRNKGVFGSLILGGYDSTRFKRNDNDFYFTFAQDPSALLKVSIESITATNSLKGTYSLTSGAHYSVVDSTVPHMWLPTAVCDQFEQAFGLTYDNQTGLYLVNDTIHQQLLSKNPTITFKLANSPAGASTNYTNIQLQYAAFDLQASWPYYRNATNYFPIRRGADPSQYVIGRTLLQEAYLIVDYERSNFSIAQAVFPDPLPAAEIVTIKSVDDTSQDSSSSGLPTGAIVGIAVGAALLVFAAIFAVFFFRRRKVKKQRYELASNQASDAASGHHMNASAIPMKSQGPSELSGTPLTELASPVAAAHYPSDQKTAVSINETPAELHAESRTPITPRWEEVRMPLHPPRSARDVDAESSGSRSVSQLPSDDGYGSNEGIRSAVSPLTGQFSQLPPFNPR